MTKKTKATIINGKTAIAIRTESDENQTTFWRRLGVTQSGGSRYESGRSMPAPVKRLMYLVYMAGQIGTPEFDAIK